MPSTILWAEQSHGTFFIAEHPTLQQQCSAQALHGCMHGHQLLRLPFAGCPRGPALFVCLLQDQEGCCSITKCCGVAEARSASMV